MLSQNRGITLLVEPTSCFSCERLFSFERKCRKSQVAHGSSGRRVTLCPGQIFSISTGPNTSLTAPVIFFFFQVVEKLAFSPQRKCNFHCNAGDSTSF